MTGSFLTLGLGIQGNFKLEVKEMMNSQEIIPHQAHSASLSNNDHKDERNDQRSIKRLTKSFKIVP